jgi:hypothetical protein
MSGCQHNNYLKDIKIVALRRTIPLVISSTELDWGHNLPSADYLHLFCKYPSTEPSRSIKLHYQRVW